MLVSLTRLGSLTRLVSFNANKILIGEDMGMGIERTLVFLD